MNVNNFGRISGTAALALTLVAIAGPVHPQTMASQVHSRLVNRVMAQHRAETEYECMQGKSMPKVDIFTAYPAAVDAVRGYWDAVKAGSPVSVAPHFHVSSNAAWRTGTLNVPMTLEAKVADPFVVPGAQLAAEPLRTFRAGKESSLHTQWEVRGAAGELIGTYDAGLVYKNSIWRLHTIELIDAKRYVEPIVQYCHDVGDVILFRLNSAEDRIRYNTEHAARMTENADTADAEVVRLQSQAASAEKGASASYQRLAQKAVNKAKKARIKADDAKLEVEAAERELARVKSDIKAMDEARAAGMAKLGGG